MRRTRGVSSHAIPIYSNGPRGPNATAPSPKVSRHFAPYNISVTNLFLTVPAPSSGDAGDLALQQRVLDSVDQGRGGYFAYSSFPVWTALECVPAASPDAPSIIVEGGNIENASLPLALCAERTALANARTIVGGPITVKRVAVFAPAVSAPSCGGCRQAICDISPQASVSFIHKREWRTLRASDLLPDAPVATPTPSRVPLISHTLLSDAHQAWKRDPSVPHAIAMTTKGTYHGCGWEGSSATPVSAVSNAVFAAVNAEGGACDITEVAVYANHACGSPNGVARQILAQFSHDPLVWFMQSGEPTHRHLRELLPIPFELAVPSKNHADPLAHH